MRVCFVTTFEDPRRPENPKGGYRRCSELARLLAPHCDLRIAAVTKRPVGDLSHLGVPWDNAVGGPLPVRLAKASALLMKRTKPGDLVLGYNPSLPASPMMLPALAGRRLAIDYVDHQGVELVPGLRQTLTRRVRDTVSDEIVRRCGFFVTSSAAIEGMVRRLNPRANVHFYRGTLDRPHPGSPPIRSGKGPLDVLYLGSMFHFSGADDVVQAVCALPEGSATLTLVGGGPHRPVVEEAVERSGGRARFVALDDEALHPALAKADVLVLPLRDHERNRYNFPSRIIEFLWAGRPILSTKVPPLEGFLVHGENAWLTKGDGPEAIREGLAALAGDAALRSRLAQGARQFFESSLAPEPSGRALVDFLREASR